MNEAPRSLASVVLATRQPACSGPMRFSTGTATSSRNTSLNSRSPVIWRSGRTSTPARVHRDRQHRDSLVRRGARIGSHQRDAQVGEGRIRRPHLLTRHPIDAAALLGARRQARQVAPRARLAEQLAPHVVAGKDPRHPPRALVVGAVRHQRRADERDPDAAEERRSAGARELLVVGGDLRRRGAPPPVLDRPVDADPTSGVQRSLPLPQRLRLGRRGRHLDVGTRMRVQPRAQLVAELVAG